MTSSKGGGGGPQGEVNLISLLISLYHLYIDLLIKKRFNGSRTPFPFGNYAKEAALTNF